jgi:hypothetical protein
MEDEFLMTSNGILSLYSNDELAWCFMTRINGIGKWVTTHEKFKVLPYRVKIQGLALIGCAYQ